MISEKYMENSIISSPEKYLGETGLKLLAQQFRIGSYVFDIPELSPKRRLRGSDPVVNSSSQLATYCVSE
jgi:hypothetical protein